MAETAAEDLAGRGDDAHVAVVDVRHGFAYQQGHIPGAVSLPLESLDDAALTREWPPEVVVVDYRGESAPGVAEELDSRLDSVVTALAGGMAAWDGVLEDAL